MQSISVHSPATVANLVCGFDILGLALEEPSDLIMAYLQIRKKMWQVYRSWL
jgi:homoserine kinase